MTSLKEQSTLTDQSLNHSPFSFSLKTIPSSDCSPVCIEANFQSSSSRQSSFSLIPCFNADKKYFTPGFCIRTEINTEQLCNLTLEKMFESKKKAYSCQNSQIYEPRPSSKYCQVCQQYFDDYLKHKKNSVHQTRIKESDISKDLDSLIVFFNSKKQKKIFKKFSTGLINQSRKDKSMYVENMKVQNQWVLNEISRPIKKLKKNMDMCSSTVSSTMTSKNLMGIKNEC